MEKHRSVCELAEGLRMDEWNSSKEYRVGLNTKVFDYIRQIIFALQVLVYSLNELAKIGASKMSRKTLLKKCTRKLLPCCREADSICCHCIYI